MEDCRQIFI